MTIYEILSFNKELLRRLACVGVKTDDFRYVDLFEDYSRMRKAGNKMTYIVAVLSDIGGVQERCSVTPSKNYVLFSLLSNFAMHKNKSRIWRFIKRQL